jgi:peptidoglycan/LPS O-acetylase OafA/YrhL
MKDSTNRIPSLDGLRAISIGLVVFSHLLQVLGFGFFGNLGNLGVRVFFVISGFLITGLLLKEYDKSRTVDLSKFYFRRTLRIFPPFYFYLFVILAVSLAGLAAVPLKNILAACLYTSDYVNIANGYLGHSWSLAVEEQFYLIFPGVFLLFGKRKTKILLLALVCLSPLIRVFDYRVFGDDFVWGTTGFHMNMDALAFGCLLSLFYFRLHQNQYYQKFLKSKIVYLFPPLIVALNLQYDHPHLYAVCFSLMNVLIALCIDWAVTNHETLTGKVLNSAPMVTLGVMSYSIYLWQQPFFNSSNPKFLTATPFNFIGLAVMVLISYYLVEKPSLKFRQKLENIIFRKKPASVMTRELELQASGNA